MLDFRGDMRTAAQILLNLADNVYAPVQTLDEPSIEQIEDRAALLADIARDELQARQIRFRCLNPELLGEPAWDILLEMFICWSERRDVMIKDAQIASGVPETTAYRYINLLEHDGLIQRNKNLNDGRRVDLHLTNKGVLSVGSFLIFRSQCPFPRSIWLAA